MGRGEHDQHAEDTVVGGLRRYSTVLSVWEVIWIAQVSSQAVEIVVCLTRLDHGGEEKYDGLGRLTSFESSFTRVENLVTCTVGHRSDNL